MTGPVAHINIGYLRDVPEVSEFWDNVDRVNGIAERWPGFVANVDYEAAELAGFAPLFDEIPEPPDPARIIATLSAWQSAHDLHGFAAKGVHGDFRDRRATWFLPLQGAAYVIWPIAPGHTPDMAEARDRLARIRAEGPSKEAYDFKWLIENTEDA